MLQRLAHLRRFSQLAGALRLTSFSRPPKGLQVTQQQAVDPLQVVQDQLVAQRAETKKLSDQIAALTEEERRLAKIDRQHAGRHDPPGRAAIRGAAETTLRTGRVWDAPRS